MAQASAPDFQTFHALRIKGFATVDTLAEMSGLPTVDVQRYLDLLASGGYAQFRDARSLWQLTPDGRAAHAERLSVDLAGLDASAALAGAYTEFLKVNTDFKVLCGDWQLRGGEINDHSDSDYDDECINRLAALDQRAQPIVASMGDVLARLMPYADRLALVRARVQAGEANMFTGVMCGSYHDAWMELHEDLILTQSIDRSAEGSF